MKKQQHNKESQGSDGLNHEDRRAFIRRALLSASLLAVAPRILLARGEGEGACTPTSRDLYGLGPFYKDSAPYREVMADVNEPGERLFITGIVYANDCISPLSDVIVDVWHADNSGAYSSLSDPNDFKLRARLKSNQQGAFAFESIKPGLYLNGSQYRPSHVHIKVFVPGGTELATQLYFQGDPYIPVDAGSSDPAAASRIIPLVQNAQGLHGVFDLVLNVPPKASSAEERPYNTGETWLRQNHPNPVRGMTTIPFHIPHATTVELAIFDILGKRVRTLIASTPQSAGTHSVGFDGRDDGGRHLPGGVYTVRLQTSEGVQTRVMTVE
jgi:protocatechuate 3,4-dioxygenase beta subunit